MHRSRGLVHRTQTHRELVPSQQLLHACPHDQKEDAEEHWCRHDADVCRQLPCLVHGRLAQQRPGLRPQAGGGGGGALAWLGQATQHVQLVQQVCTESIRRNITHAALCWGWVTAAGVKCCPQMDRRSYEIQFQPESERTARCCCCSAVAEVKLMISGGLQAPMCLSLGLVNIENKLREHVA